MFYHVSLLSSVGDIASHGQADSVSELRQLPAADGEPRAANLADVSLGRRKRARRELEERRLSRAVRADDARPRAFGEMRGDAAEKWLGHPRIGKGDVVELEEAGHGAIESYRKSRE